MPHILITGAAGGLGRHLVGVWSRRGWRVSATDLDAAAIGVIGRQDGWSRNVFVDGLDVSDTAAWDRVWAAAEAANGAVDVLVNNAGVLIPGWATDLDDRAISLHVDVNVKGVMFGTQRAVKAMVQRGRGHIINVGSLAALSPVPGLSLYAGSKFAVRGFSLSVAAELDGTGVALTVIEPDAIATPMLDVQADREEAVLTFSGGRVLSPADIADAIDHILERRPLEVVVPPARGVLAKAAGLAPHLGMRLAPWLRRLGRRGQAKFKRN